ncbi:MAG: alpha/beta fold hydrolase [Rhizobium sp.]
MPFATVGDSEFYYETIGNGPPLILVTGLAGVASYWDPNIAALAEHFTITRYDHRGTGRSVRSEMDYSIELLADDLVGLMDVLGIARASLLGHSTGAAIGQVIAAKFPERLDQMILYGAWSTLCPQMKLCFDLRLDLLDSGGAAAYHKGSAIFLYPPRFVCDEIARIQADLVKAVANSATPSVLKARAHAVLNYDGTAYLPKIDMPTLVLVARDDILTPVSESEELVAGIANATLQILDYGAHAASVSDPAPFNDAVLAFLRANGAQDGSTVAHHG